MLRFVFVASLVWGVTSAALAQQGDEEATGDEAPEGEEEEATGSTEARAHFARGQTAYNQGDYDSALEEWNAAYELDPRPRIQFNLSQAYERLGRLSDAAAALDRYLETANPDDAMQSDARARRAALRERLGRTGVRIVGAPDGAAILIDEQDWGRTPRPDAIGVEPGSHQVVLKLDGYRDFTATIVVPAGQVVDVEVEMVEAQEPERIVVESGGGSAWPWVFMGAGGAFTLVATLLGAAALGAASDAEFSDDSDADGAKGLAAVADIMGIFSLALIGTGFVWLLLQDDGSEEVETETASFELELAPVVGPDGAGAAARVTF